MKVLYVEDNKINAILVESALEGVAFVDIAETGHEGIRLAQAHDYDVYLLDINLNDPNLDGFGVLRKLKHELQLPGHYIATTAYVHDNWEDKCLEAGFDAYISKPVDVSLLIEMVARHGKPS